MYFRPFPSGLDYLIVPEAQSRSQVCVTLLKKDTGLDNTHEIKTVMLCREIWSGVARCFRASRNADLNQTADNQNSSVIVLFHLVVL